MLSERDSIESLSILIKDKERERLWLVQDDNMLAG